MQMPGVCPAIDKDSLTVGFSSLRWPPETGRHYSRIPTKWSATEETPSPDWRRGKPVGGPSVELLKIP
jgi:hypothetical protein